MENQKNLILAVVFSIVVLVVFDTFFAPKTPEFEDKPIDQDSAVSTEEKNIPIISDKFKAEDQNSVQEKRITFDTKRLRGVN